MTKPLIEERMRPPLWVIGALCAAWTFGISACADEPKDEVPTQPACLKIPHTAEADWQEAFDATDDGAFLSVWGTGPCDVVTVGGQPGAGVAYHFNGETWNKISLPPVPMLNWVHGVDGELWMSGEQGVTLRGTVEGGFEVIPTGVDAPLWGIWATSSDDVWTVGGDIAAEDAAPVLLHWDGAGWQQETLPDTDRPAKALFKVLASASDDVLAVGQFGLVYHFDGQSWRLVPSGTSEDFISLWGLSPDNIAIVGGRSNAVLGRWDGQGVTSEVLAGQPAMNGIWMDVTGQVHIVGIFGAIARITEGDEPVSEIGPTQDVLHGTWGVDGGPRFAVGGSLNRNPPFTGAVIIDP